MQTEQLTLTQKFLNIFSDPFFWIVSGGFALLINVLAYYVTRRTDRLLSVFSSRRKRKVEERAHLLNQEVQRLIANPGERFDLKLDILFYVLRQILMAVLTAISVSIVAAEHNLWRLIFSLSAMVTLTMILVYFKRERKALRILWAFQAHSKELEKAKENESKLAPQ